MKSIEERFWPKVDKTETHWFFTGTRDRPPYDYGSFRIGKQKIKAHRVSWELTFGAIPNGLWVLHHCDTPACVRPDHLFLGTNAMNQRDATRKGKHEHLRSLDHPRGGPKGEKAGAAKLTETQVREIRASTEPQRALGKLYGVSGVAICKIRTRQTWTHVL